MSKGRDNFSRQILYCTHQNACKNQNLNQLHFEHWMYFMHRLEGKNPLNSEHSIHGIWNSKQFRWIKQMYWSKWAQNNAIDLLLFNLFIHRNGNENFTWMFKWFYKKNESSTILCAHLIENVLLFNHLNQKITMKLNCPRKWRMVFVYEGKRNCNWFQPLFWLPSKPHSEIVHTNI